MNRSTVVFGLVAVSGSITLAYIVVAHAHWMDHSIGLPDGANPSREKRRPEQSKQPDDLAPPPCPDEQDGITPAAVEMPWSEPRSVSEHTVVESVASPSQRGPIVEYPGFSARELASTDHVTGVIRDVFGRPVPRARVEIRWVMKYPTVETARASPTFVLSDRVQDENLVWWGRAEAVADDDGVFSLRAPPAVQVRVYVFGREAGTYLAWDGMEIVFQQ